MKQFFRNLLVIATSIVLAISIAACGGGDTGDNNENGSARSMLMSPGQAVGSDAGGLETFGPKQYVRTTGAPNIYHDTIIAQPGEAWLVIKNGLEGPKTAKNKRVRSGVVSLNGTVLFSHNDFKHQTYILETPVSLLAENNLRVELEGIPGTFISIEIIQLINDPVYDILATDLRVSSENCPDYMEISLRLTNIGEAEVPPGLQVAFYNGSPGEGGVFIGSTTSTTYLASTQYEDVTFRWLGPGGQEVVLYARADDDGSGAGLYEEVDEANNLVSLITLLCPVVPPGGSSISGRVIDAVTGELLSGINTRLHLEENGGPGAVVASVQTGSEGEFLFSGLAAGSYVLATAPSGYITEGRSVTIAENIDLSNQDLVLSPVLGDDEIRIILTWGETPADLEAHLTAPSPAGCRFHCYYWNKTIPGASLDLDDRDGYGPETITITKRTPGTYRYYVHDFTNRNTNSRWLALSGAEVKVYSGGKEPLVFTVPYGYGNVWHVFDLDGETGEVIPVQILSRQSEPGRIDYPVITSSGPTSAYWGSLYTYQVKATDPDNDALTYSLLSAPAGMIIDPVTGLIEWTPTGGQSGTYKVEVKVEDGRCGETTQTFNVYVYSTPTAQFSVNPCSGVNPGGDITLTWSTTRATTVLIDQGIGEVPLSGSLTIPSPEEPTLYTLTAFNDAVLVKRTVPASPTASFYFSPNRIYPGQSTTLYWDPRCFANASIDHDIGAVSSAGSMVLIPSGTTSYNLTVSNAALTRTYKATVYVVSPPPPSSPGGSISITPTCNLTPGEPMTLSWSTSNATYVTISPGIGEVATSGSMLVYPTEAGTYTLTASGPGGTITRSVTFPNYPGLSFSSSAYGIDLGDSVKLQWSASCADIVTMNQGVGEVSASGSLTVTPESLPVTYTVTAANERGPRSISRTLYQIAPSGTFTAAPTVLKVGDSTTLSWTSTRADSCSITPDVGEVDCNGSAVVTPAKPTSYTLTMVGPGGTYRRYASVSFVAPVADLKASAYTIMEGESVILTWVFANATGCSINQGIGEVELGGQVVVSPTTTTTYTMTAIGPGGTATDKVTINVTPANPPPIVSLSASNSIIVRGDAVVLNWQSSYADSLEIQPEIGTVPVTGNATVSPETTTTYTATASGQGGTSTAKVTITVLQPTPSINLQADPVEIMAGDSAVLNWTSSNADRVTFNQGIGEVPLEGTLTVSPATTTTFTATAAGPGGTTTRSVTVTVSHPAPTVILSAEPASIKLGEEAVLSWSSTNAHTVSISPVIGTVESSGSLPIAPEVDTTYYITASGYGGEATSQVTVTVIQPAPTASISAEPTPITTGESTTLEWSTQYANSCSIEPDIGTVPCAGQISINPAQDTDYILTAEGPGGTSTAQVTVIVNPASPITLIITSPLEGDTIHRPDVRVTGAVSHSQGLETGVVVNGVVALVHDGTFVADHVPLEPGENTLDVLAIDINEKFEVKTVNLTRDPSARYVALNADTSSGLSPLEVGLRLDAGFTQSVLPVVRYAGPGAAEFLTTTEPDTWNLRLTTPGLYELTVETRDENEILYADTTAVLVMDRTAFDALLQAKWQGMKAAMIAGDIDKAVSHFSWWMQDTFREIFTLTGDQLAQIALDMQDIELIYQKNDTAEYRIRKDVIFKGAPETITFYIYFERGPDGIWRIRDF